MYFDTSPSSDGLELNLASILTSLPDTRMDQLYGLYRTHMTQFLADIARTREAEGMGQPDKQALRVFNREEFETQLAKVNEEPELSLMWLRKIAGGAQADFPELRDLFTLPMEELVSRLHSQDADEM